MVEAAILSQVVFRLSSKDVAGEINLKPEVWRVLTRVDGVHTVAQIAKSSGLDEAAVTRAAVSLYKSGLLEVLSGNLMPPPSTVDGAFFEKVTRELARVMGPLAIVVVEDEVSALGEKKDGFPRERVAELVERVGEAVRDDQKRLLFQKVMLDVIRAL